jgi:hypothetical protein
LQDLKEKNILIEVSSFSAKAKALAETHQQLPKLIKVMRAALSAYFRRSRFMRPCSQKKEKGRPLSMGGRKKRERPPTDGGRQKREDKTPQEDELFHLARGA